MPAKCSYYSQCCAQSCARDHSYLFNTVICCKNFQRSGFANVKDHGVIVRLQTAVLIIALSPVRHDNLTKNRVPDKAPHDWPVNEAAVVGER